MSNKRSLELVLIAFQVNKQVEKNSYVSGVLLDQV